MPINDFKIIAVKPLKDCHDDLRKILKKNETYFFFQNCSIDSNENLVENEGFLSVEFFSGNLPQIDINAVVGKNGSGKSTVVELFLMAMNNLSCRYVRYNRQLKVVEGLHVCIYFQLGNLFYKLEVKNEEAEIYKYSPRRQKMVIDKRISLKSLFYVVAVNYSHYAYNELDYPKNRRWLPGVFHKNDGYQIPLVLNPYRDKGNIDINSENLLVNARLVANLLRPSTDGDFDYRRLTQRHKASYLKLALRQFRSTDILYSYNDNKIKESVEVRMNSLKIDKDAITKLLSENWGIPIRKFSLERNIDAVDYIYRKLVSICLKYEIYNEFFIREDQDFAHGKLEHYIKVVLIDRSHIAFKLKQALNFIKFELIEPGTTKLDLDDFGGKIYATMKRKSSKILELIELLPPPIFKVEIMMTDDNWTEELEFSKLSSGEKQWNYSVSSILYHLNNLDSVPRDASNRNFYDRVFVLLEEIELYFHPDMQRRYVNHLIKSIEHLRLGNIQHIQIMLVTHSPFTLSDIPVQNILFLKGDGYPDDKKNLTKTFGGNIHELLAKSFFLEDSLIGAFARKKIEYVIAQVQPDAPQLNESARLTLLETILLIGEDFLRDKLLEMLAAKFGNFSRQEQILLLEAQLKKLKDDQTETES